MYIRSQNLFAVVRSHYMRGSQGSSQHRHQRMTGSHLGECKYTHACTHERARTHTHTHTVIQLWSDMHSHLMPTRPRVDKQGNYELRSRAVVQTVPV
jgi:hypothetical protein